jgi:hypothetical protein
MNQLYNENLKICFLIKLGDRFYNESEIAENLAILKNAASCGDIDLDTTDGAISLRYNDEELLGIDFWDEINLIAGSISGQLPHLLQGQIVTEFFPLNSLWLSLTPKGERVLYELRSNKNLLPVNIKRSLSTKHFIHEFQLMFLRMAKLLAELGSFSAEETLKGGDSLIHLSLKSVIGVDSIRKIVNQPLKAILGNSGCSETEG